MIIDQALFGYSNGHRLIASSIDIPASMLKILEPLTDWSGADFDNGFSEYFTGYFFEPENLFIISKTWYAYEMSRPGCAWSHTFLINTKYLGDCRLSSSIIKHFERPNPEMNYSNYKEKLIVESISNLNNYNEIPHFKDAFAKKVISSVYEAAMPVIIPAIEYDTFSSTFLMLWLKLGGNILKNTSFCTGSFSNRTINKKTIDFQVVPHIKVKTILRSDRNAILIENINVDQSAWTNKIIDSYVKGSDTRLLSFIELISSNANDKFVIKSCTQIYEGLEKNDSNIDQLLSFVGTNLMFDDQKEIATNTVIERINRIFSWDNSSGGLTTQVNFFKDLLLFEMTSTEMLDTNRLCETLKLKKFKDNNLVGKIFHFILNHEVNELGEICLGLVAQYILNQTNIQEILDSNYNGCHILIKSNSNIALKKEVWKAPINEQIRIIGILQISSAIKCEQFSKELSQIIFTHASQEILEALYGLFGPKLVEYYLTWSDSCINSELVCKWIEICKFDIKSCIVFVETHSDSIISKFLWCYINPYGIVKNS